MLRVSRIFQICKLEDYQKGRKKKFNVCMKAIAEMLQTVKTVFIVTLKESRVHKMGRLFKEKMIDATLLLVGPLPFEESLHSLNILMVNYCRRAVLYKIHFGEKVHILQDYQVSSSFLYKECINFLDDGLGF